MSSVTVVRHSTATRWKIPIVITGEYFTPCRVNWNSFLNGVQMWNAISHFHKRLSNYVSQDASVRPVREQCRQWRTVMHVPSAFEWVSQNNRNNTKPQPLSHLFMSFCLMYFHTSLLLLIFLSTTTSALQKLIQFHTSLTNFSSASVLLLFCVCRCHIALYFRLTMETWRLFVALWRLNFISLLNTKKSREWKCTKKIWWYEWINKTDEWKEIQFIQLP